VASSPKSTWLSVFLNIIYSFFIGLPLGGLLFASTGLVLTLHQSDPIIYTPWVLVFRTILAWVAFVFLGGFAWTPEEGYRSLHAWYGAGVFLSFVLLMRPWRRRSAT